MRKSRRPPNLDETERPSRRRLREVTPDEATLWEQVAQTIEPLRPVKRAKGAAVTPPDAARPPKGRSAPRPAAKPAPARTDLQPFESKRARRLAKGRLEIEARLDLHGMRQSEAHAALLRFITDAHARGLRHVKIITGKGRPADQGRDNGSWLDEREERGVLKRMVPVWLAEPAMRAMVVSFTEAGRGHGGEGALYVQVRRPSRARS